MGAIWNVVNSKIEPSFAATTGAVKSLKNEEYIKIFYLIVSSCLNHVLDEHLTNNSDDNCHSY